MSNVSESYTDLDSNDSSGHCKPDIVNFRINSNILWTHTRQNKIICNYEASTEYVFTLTGSDRNSTHRSIIQAA